VYLNELIQAVQSSPEQTVLGANCYDGYQQYYDPDYNEKHQPNFSLGIRRESSSRLAEVRA